MSMTASQRHGPRPATIEGPPERRQPASPPSQAGDEASTGRPSPAARALVALVHAYQRWISPALAPRCRFYPSCSAYAVTAIERFGAARGSALAVWRLLKCQPFHPGGIDHVPPRPGRE